MISPLTNAAPFQITFLDRPWQVLNEAGFVIAHCKGRRTADATSALYPGSTVRYSG